MKTVLLLIALLLNACSSMQVKPLLTYQAVYSFSESVTPPIELDEKGIPVECYDAEGNFDSNRGHDYLDCDNLDNRVKF